MEQSPLPLILLSGPAGVGKDRLANALARGGLPHLRGAFATALRKVCAKLFDLPVAVFEGVNKDSPIKVGRFSTPREALQLIGTDVLRETVDYDIWVRALATDLAKQYVEASDFIRYIIVTDCRFSNELKLGLFLRELGVPITHVISVGLVRATHSVKQEASKHKSEGGVYTSTTLDLIDGNDNENAARLQYIIHCAIKDKEDHHGSLIQEVDWSW